ncbi:hypothetical protein PHLCEN_2v12714 [Hermanssonia centrifuga]|uniref:Uncharacterized protein n=1 Tax=Hermanssonia centrifuga TaxID=98765 RepID=A0A2R6NGD6_9APHY|nr:hypothetical protein PHLCEN_2v12714 [Hermanssonia centrifuga]
MTCLIPAWKSKKVPHEKNEEPMIGTTQCMLAALVQPNQNMEIYSTLVLSTNDTLKALTGNNTAPTIAMGRRASGEKPEKRCELSLLFDKSVEHTIFLEHGLQH